MVTGTKIFFLALLLQRLDYCEGVSMTLMSRAQKAKAAFQQNKANKNQELCWRREKCCFCWRGSVRYRRRHTGASGLNDFWPRGILWVLVFFHVAVTDVHHHTGGGLCSCVQLVFLSWIGREKQSKDQSKGGNVSSNTARGTAGLQNAPHLGRELSVLLLNTGEHQHSWTLSAATTHPGDAVLGGSLITGLQGIIKYTHPSVHNGFWYQYWWLTALK